MDLSDCSRLLYHWAISPPLLTPLFDSTCLKYRSGKASEKEMRKQMGKQYWCGQRPLAAVFGIISMGCNIVQFWHQRRRWYNGQHSCLPSSWSGFDSRPTQCFKFYFGQNWDKKVLSMPWPGFEPGLLRPQRRVLTTRRSRLRTVVLMRRTFVLAYYQKC